MKWIGLIPVFFVDKPSLDKHGITHGASYGFFVLIIKKYENDKGLLAHEAQHVKQFWTRGLMIHKLLYAFWKYYRFKCELDAYVKQWKISNGDEKLRDLFVLRIRLCYNLNYSKDYVLNKFVAKINS
jgi:hypothetical protein